MPSPNLKPMLETSTAHLRVQDIDALAEYTGDPMGDGHLRLKVYPTSDGWYVSAGALYVGDDLEALASVEADIRGEGFSEGFVALLKHAKENGAGLVCFDSDAEPEPGFPVYEYGTDNEIQPEEVLGGPTA